MQKFYFNTGVRQYGHIPPIKPVVGEVWRGGTLQVPFECADVPEGAQFKFACDYPDLPEAQYENWIVRPVHNSALLSQFAYFVIPDKAA